MSNQIESLMPKIISRGLLSLREKAILPRLVNGSLSQDIAHHGDRVTVPVSKPIEVADVTPSHEQPSPADSTLTHISVVLDKWKRASFHLTDKEMLQIDASENFLPLQMGEAIHALATSINQSILDLFVGNGAVLGHPGETPFSSIASSTSDAAGIQAAIASRKLLNKAHAPKTGRVAVIDYDAEAHALALSQFADVQKSGMLTIPMEGEIGRRFGIDWFSVDTVAKSAVYSAVLTVSTAAPIGASTVTISGKHDGIKPGTLLNPSGDTSQILVVKSAALSNTNTNLTLARPLTVKVAAAEKLKPYATRPVNIVMHRDAVALVMRPLSSAGMDSGAHGQIMSVTDPETGLSLRLEVSRQYKQTVWEFDVLWGVKILRPEWMIRLYG